MVQRIRTVKPQNFLHAGLYDAEQQCGLPLRYAFIGLFTCSDKEGRFRWSPRELKPVILPHDNLDFEVILNTLAAEGFIIKYRYGSSCYGFIPSWYKHQRINHREPKSEFPPPPPLPTSNEHPHGVIEPITNQDGLLKAAQHTQMRYTTSGASESRGDSDQTRHHDAVVFRIVVALTVYIINMIYFKCQE